MTYTGVNGMKRAEVQLIRVVPPSSLSVPYGIEGLFLLKQSGYAKIWWRISMYMYTERKESIYG